MVDEHPIAIYLNKIVKTQKLKVLLMNEAKLSDEERSRLYCRRFGYYDTNMLKIMTNFDKFKGLPKLIPLNEDNRLSKRVEHPLCLQDRSF